MSRYLGYIVDLLVTPISPWEMIIAYTLAAMMRGITVGVVVFLISLSFTTLPLPHPILALGMLIAASFLFAQFGILAAIFSKNFDTLSMYTNFLILPLIYLGGLFYPVNQLPPFWQKLSLLNPVSYMIDGFRAASLGAEAASYSFEVSLGVTSLFALGLFFAAAGVIKSGYKLRV